MFRLSLHTVFQYRKGRADFSVYLGVNHLYTVEFRGGLRGTAYNFVGVGVAVVLTSYGDDQRLAIFQNKIYNCPKIVR